MITFLQFITENEKSITLYHATTNKHFDPKNVPPGLHFGTKKAAQDRAKDDDVKKYGKPKIHKFQYHPQNKGHEIPDFENNVSFKIHEHLHKKGLLSKPSWEKANKVGHDKYLKDELAKKNIHHLSYKNEHEDAGSTSHIVFDSHNLKHLDTK